MSNNRNTFGANTAQASEGTVGTGISASVGTTTATIGEYADYANFSSLSLATAIDPVVENVGLTNSLPTINLTKSVNLWYN